MEISSLMYNSYNPYGDFNSDIGNIIETEKQINLENMEIYNKEKAKLFPIKKIKVKDINGNEKTKTELDTDHISERITFTLNDLFNDLSNKEYSNIFSKTKWCGYGYIFILLYICYFISKL